MAVIKIPPKIFRVLRNPFSSFLVNFSLNFHFIFRKGLLGFYGPCSRGLYSTGTVTTNSIPDFIDSQFDPEGIRWLLGIPGATLTSV